MAESETHDKLSKAQGRESMRARYPISGSLRHSLKTARHRLQYLKQYADHHNTRQIDCPPSVEFGRCALKRKSYRLNSDRKDHETHACQRLALAPLDGQSKPHVQPHAVASLRRLAAPYLDLDCRALA